MSDVIHQNFSSEGETSLSEKKSSEDDIELFGRQIVEKKSSPEHKNSSERELIRQTLPAIQKTAVQSPTAAVKPASQLNTLPDYMKNSPAEIAKQVGIYVDKVFQNGLTRTIGEVQKNFSDPFFLDAFHDALTDKLYEELKKRKML